MILKRRAILARLNGEQVCPYCQKNPPKPITRSGKCKHCRQHIYVRTIEGKKLLMTELESWATFHYPYIGRTNERGNPRLELCVCRKCGDVRLHFWQLYIDHFPLQCPRCEARAVMSVWDRDNVLDDKQFVDGLDEKADRDVSRPDAIDAIPGIDP